MFIEYHLTEAQPRAARFTQQLFAWEPDPVCIQGWTWDQSSEKKLVKKSKSS